MKTGLILGFFDGVHKGHRVVIQSASDCCDKTVLLTFKESPAIYFGKKAEYVMRREDSINKIKALGVSEVIESDFSKIAGMGAQEYLEYLISEYSPYSISTGFNHTFGLNKSGNPEFLKNNQRKYGYKYICTPPVLENEEIISSSKIREFLAEGDIETANLLLESNFTLRGNVIHGKQIGRTIGFPTANISYPKELVKIPFGVYKTEIMPDFTNGKDGKKYKAITNWGMKPTVNNTLEPVFETHIPGFDGDLYGADVKIEVIRRIREEIRFESLEELKNQIAKDIETCSE